MPKVKTIAPKPSREKGERNIDPSRTFFNRRILPLQVPSQLTPEQWRYLVMRQPIAMACRETLIANIINLDWKIEPRDTEQRDELKSEIDKYTRMFTDNGDIDYTEHIEWITKDCLDLPFGAGTETIRMGDKPDGEVVYYEPLDGGTLYPYPNRDWPVFQYVGGITQDPIFFPNHAINRMYFSPQTNIYKRGWGIPPPEKIYVALDLIARGDQYYANLFLDTPQAGLLDLHDMDKESASEWVEAWQAMMVGTDPYKVAVLYEHENDAKWIPFTRSPTEMMFDKGFTLYAALVCAGYGMTLGDIGLPSSASGGETLSGTIRGERKTKRTGFARLKKKIKLYFDRMLPDNLEFKFIDLDEELNVALGRARLASATAQTSWITAGMFSPQEMRQQVISDGLITVSVPETIPTDALPPLQGGQSAERPNSLGRPVSPSDGGYGEVSMRGNLLVERIEKVRSVPDVELRRLAFSGSEGVREVLEAGAWRRSFDEGGELPLESNSALHIMKTFLRGRSWWSLGDTTEIIDDLYELAREVQKEIYIAAQEEMYVKGMVNEITEIEPKLDKGLVRKFVVEATEVYPEYLTRGIMKGLFRFVDKHGIDGIISNDIREIREGMNIALDDFLEHISKAYAERIKEWL